MKQRGLGKGLNALLSDEVLNATQNTNIGIQYVDINDIEPNYNQPRKQFNEEELAELYRIYKQILEEKHCISLKDLALTGSDLIQAGMKPGKEIGEVLQYLFEIVLENPECNTKEILLKKVADKMPK